MELDRASCQRKWGSLHIVFLLELHLLSCGATDSAVSLRASENPTVLLSQKAGSLGAVAEDSLSRVQLEVSSGLNQAEIAFRHLAVA